MIRLNICVVHDHVVRKFKMTKMWLLEFVLIFCRFIFIAVVGVEAYVPRMWRKFMLIKQESRNKLLAAP